MKTPPYPRIVRRRSRLHGWGVFALEPISKNTRIIHYAGEELSYQYHTGGTAGLACKCVPGCTNRL